MVTNYLRDQASYTLPKYCLASPSCRLYGPTFRSSRHIPAIYCKCRYFRVYTFSRIYENGQFRVY